MKFCYHITNSPIRYCNYNYYLTRFQKKRRLSAIFTKIIKPRLEQLLRTYNRKKFMYFTIYRKINIGFYITIPYNAYQGKLLWAKRTYLNFKYHFRIQTIKAQSAKTRYLRPKRFAKTLKFRIILLCQFLYVYIDLPALLHVDLFHLAKSLQTRQQRVGYFLILSFTKSRLFVNLQNLLHKNFFFFSNGLFLKFFGRKKSLKKHKTIKLLTAKFLRKLFLVTHLRTAILIIKKTPLYLLEMLNLFNTPIIYKFTNPIENTTIEERLDDFLLIRFLYFIFLENKNFTFNKQKKRGRVKRKISRKLVLVNKVID